MVDTKDRHVGFEVSAPILRVENMEASLHFYVDLLGFKNASWGNNDFTHLKRDGAGIYLCRGDQGRGGAWVWIGVEMRKSFTKSANLAGSRSVFRRPIIRGLWRCKSRTLTATCSASDQSLNEESAAATPAAMCGSIIAGRARP